MRILLDTCSFLWIITNAKELSPSAASLFSDPTNEIYLSPVSVWEILVKHGAGRLTLTEPPLPLIRQQRELHRIASVPLDEESVFHLATLPDRHRDPFDRMLVCQAIANGLAILTPDPLITQYPVRTLW